MLNSSIFVTLLSIGSSILGFAVQLLLAQYFGVTAKAEAYFFSLSIPTFSAGIISTILAYTLVPRLVNCEKNSIYHRKYIVSILMGVTFIAFILMGILMSTLSKWQIYSLPFKSPIREDEDLNTLILLAHLIGAFQIVQSSLTAILNSIRLYISASALNILPYLGTLTSLWVFGPSIGILAVPLGTLCGTIISIIVQTYLLRFYLFPLLSLSNLLWPELMQLICNAPFMVIAMSCFSSYLVVDAYWGPRAGVGTLATLAYAHRLMIGVGNLAVAGPMVVTVPRMAELVRDGKYETFRRFLLYVLAAVGSISCGLALVLILFGDTIIEILFARGEFGQQQVTDLSMTLKYMAPGMVALMMSAIAFRALFCFPNMERVASILGVLWTTSYFLISYLLYNQGAIGIALSYSFSWSIFFISLMTIVFSSLKKLMSLK
jgi:putative peptidoglycan lipid II flippase